MSLIEQARLHLDNNGILLDVRSAEEYNEGHFDGSLNMPIPHPPLSVYDISEIANRIYSLVQQVGIDRPFIVFCAKGIRASLVAAILRNFDVKNIIDLHGVEMEPLKTLIGSKERL